MENEEQDMKGNDNGMCECPCHHGGMCHGKRRGKHGCRHAGACCGSLWFIGWLFTLGFLKLAFWKGVLAIIIWPYYIGTWVHGLLQ